RGAVSSSQARAPQITIIILYRHASPIITFFSFTAPAPTEIYTLSLHDALPIWVGIAVGVECDHAVTLRLLDRDVIGEHRRIGIRSEEHTSELQSLRHLVCRLLLEKKKI